MAGRAGTQGLEVALEEVKARENPFRSECVERLAFRAGDFDWIDAEARLEASGGRGALVGPEGHGKTTLLLEWAERVRGSGEQAEFVKVGFRQRRLNPDQRTVARSAGNVFIDSAEQLGWLGWREVLRLTAEARRLVVTLHRAGRLPTVYRCRTSPELLGDLVRELGGVDCDVEGLWKRHRGNIRHALRELYDGADDGSAAGSGSSGCSGSQSFDSKGW